MLGPERQAWVVGGAVRDALVGGGPGDLDIAVPSGAVDLVRELADLLGAAFHVLDEARGAGRVAGGPDHAWQGPRIDIVDFRAPDLIGDLRGRDFTVNALAIGVVPLVAAGEADVEDPTGGRADLGARTVRLCTPRSLEDDPIRVLRAARFGAQRGWTLDPAVEGAALRAAPGLTRVSAERVRDEIFAILAGPASVAGLRLLDSWGALEVLLDRKSTRLNSSHSRASRMPSSA